MDNLIIIAPATGKLWGTASMPGKTARQAALQTPAARAQSFERQMSVNEAPHLFRESREAHGANRSGALLLRHSAS
jgi:hypothetical protein